MSDKDKKITFKIAIVTLIFMIGAVISLLILFTDDSVARFMIGDKYGYIVSTVEDMQCKSHGKRFEYKIYCQSNDGGDWYYVDRSTYMSLDKGSVFELYNYKHCFAPNVDDLISVVANKLHVYCTHALTLCVGFGILGLAGLLVEYFICRRRLSN